MSSLSLGACKHMVSDHLVGMLKRQFKPRKVLGSYPEIL